MKKLPEKRPSVLANRQFQDHADQLYGKNSSEIFTYIYDTNLWGSAESQSGVGSEDSATRTLRLEIPRLLRQWNARILLDLPCGDFGWLSQVDLGVEEYIGADIVEKLIQGNKERYIREGNHRQFFHLDLTRDDLPRADVVLCRDCLVHLPFADIFRAFANLKRSGSTYLLTTTFTELNTNTDIVTGDWRPLNLEKPPFSLAPPLDCIVEGCTEEDGVFADKSLGLWEIANLPF